MQNLFLTEKDVFNISIFAAEDKEGVIYCDLEKDGVAFLLGKRDVAIEEYEVTFKKPSFGDILKLTDILISSREFDSDGVDYPINPIAAKLKTMTYLIKDWTFKDSEGATIPPTEENIMKMNPVIATAISVQLESYIGVGGADKKPVEEKSE